MNFLCEINDQNLLGRPGRSDKLPRIAARAVLRNSRGEYALMYYSKYGFHTLPGGGVEHGEDILTALHREILEETGCRCDEVREIGMIYENRACHDFTQQNYYYAVTSLSQSSPHYTYEEESSGTELQWHSFERLCELISTPTHALEQRRYFQARDMAALEKYRELYL